MTLFLGFCRSVCLKASSSVAASIRLLASVGRAQWRYFLATRRLHFSPVQYTFVFLRVQIPLCPGGRLRVRTEGMHLTTNRHLSRPGICIRFDFRCSVARLTCRIRLEWVRSFRTVFFSRFESETFEFDNYELFVFYRKFWESCFYTKMGQKTTPKRP